MLRLFQDELMHHGVKGMHWGVRRFQNTDGTLTPAGKQHYSVFVSGSSKTQTKDSPYYRKKLPKKLRKELNSSMKNNHKIIVGDAPGIDRQVQDYVNKKKYNNIEVFSPGTKNRYLANSSWNVRYVNDKRTKEGSKAWLAAKDKVMSKEADYGLAVTLDEGSKATKRNIERLQIMNKPIKNFELSKLGKKFDKWRF